MTIGETISNTRRFLREKGIADADSDAVWMMTALLSVSRAQLLLSASEPFPAALEGRLADWTGRRSMGEPLQYIVGYEVFLGYHFRVNEDVLIPRPETELLCEWVLREMSSEAARVLDLCCGSGCIGISVAKQRPGAQVFAADISAPAIAVARENAEAIGADITLCQGDLFAPFQGQQPFHVIVSNPPYVPSHELSDLADEVKREPSMALDGGEDGLAFYRRIAKEAPKYLCRPGSVYLEVGHDQARQVAGLFQARGAMVETRKDLHHIDRYVKAVW